MTAIRKHPTGGYIARPIIDGHKKTVRAATKTEVERQVAALKAKRQREVLGIPDPDARPERITYDALCEKVLAQYANASTSKQTLTYNLARSRRQFKDVPVHELLPETIGAWLATVTGSPTTKRMTLKAMRYALKRAALWGYVTRNAAAETQMPPEPSYDAAPFESWDEVRHVANAMKNDRDQAIVLFACATGLRPQEWRAIQWRDIDRPNRLLRISRTVRDGIVTDSTAKTHSSLRNVMLSDLALEALDLLPTPLRRDALVFPGRDGVSPIDDARWRRTRWTAALTKAGLAYRPPYGMRDTFATLNLNAGLPLEWISEQMGHTEIDTTRKHYARWQRSTDDRMLAAMNAAQSVQTGLKADSANG